LKLMPKDMPKIPPKTKVVEVIPQDLKDQWGAITALATAANVINKGYYPHHYASVARSSIAYIAELHKTMVEKALTHPQAHMISELKEIQKQINDSKKEAKKNGTSQKDAQADAVIGSVDPENSTEFDQSIHPTPSPSGGGEAHP
jgi:hypothetical protein